MKKILYSLVLLGALPAYAQNIGGGNTFDPARDEIAIERDGTFEGNATAISVQSWITSTFGAGSIDPSAINWPLLTAATADLIAGAISNDGIDPQKIDWASLTAIDLASLQAAIDTTSIEAGDSVTITSASPFSTLPAGVAAQIAGNASAVSALDGQFATDAELTAIAASDLDTVADGFSSAGGTISNSGTADVLNLDVVPATTAAALAAVSTPLTTDVELAAAISGAADADGTADSFASTGGTVVNVGTADALDLDVAASVALDSEVATAVTTQATAQAVIDAAQDAALTAAIAGDADTTADSFTSTGGTVVNSGTADGLDLDIDAASVGSAVAGNAAAMTAISGAVTFPTEVDGSVTNELGALTIDAAGNIAYDADGNADFAGIDLATQAELTAVAGGGDLTVDSFTSTGGTIANSGTADALDLDINVASTATALAGTATALATDAEVTAAIGAAGVNDLSDVDTTGLASGDVLQWNGTNFVPITLAALVAAANPDDLANAVAGDASSLLTLANAIVGDTAARTAFANGMVDPATTNTIRVSTTGRYFENDAVVPAP